LKIFIHPPYAGIYENNQKLVNKNSNKENGNRVVMISLSLALTTLHCQTSHTAGISLIVYVYPPYYVGTHYVHGPPTVE